MAPTSRTIRESDDSVSKAKFMAPPITRAATPPPPATMLQNPGDLIELSKMLE